MKRARSKKRADNSYRSADSDNRHWLDEGIRGQDCLFDDLTKQLFVLDPEICKRASQFAHRFDSGDDRPVAFIVAESMSVSWYLGYLSKFFQVWILTDEVDTLLEEACQHFDVGLADDEACKNLQGQVDFLLLIRNDFGNSGEFLQSVDECLDLLSIEGEAHFVLAGENNRSQKGEQKPDDRRVSLGADSLQITELEHSALFNGLQIQVSEEPLGLEKQQLREAATGFLERHKKFFGKNSTGLLLERCEEEEFSRPNSRADGSQEMAFLLTVS